MLVYIWCNQYFIYPTFCRWWRYLVAVVQWRLWSRQTLGFHPLSLEPIWTRCGPTISVWTMIVTHLLSTISIFFNFFYSGGTRYPRQYAGWHSYNWRNGDYNLRADILREKQEDRIIWHEFLQVEWAKNYVPRKSSAFDPSKVRRCEMIHILKTVLIDFENLRSQGVMESLSVRKTKRNRSQKFQNLQRELLLVERARATKEMMTRIRTWGQADKVEPDKRGMVGLQFGAEVIRGNKFFQLLS